jgi:chromate transporter
MGVPLASLLAVGAFAAIALLRLPLIWVLLGLGAVGSVAAWRRLR